MKFPRISLLFILVITLTAVIVDLPANIPLKFSLGSLKIDRVMAPPGNISTHLGIDLLGGTQLVLEADMTGVPDDEKERALESAKEIVERRVNFFGVAEPVIQTARSGGSYRVMVEIPGIKDVDEAIATLGQTAQLEFREFISEATESAFFATIENTRPVDVNGRDLKSAEVTFDQNTGEPVVAFEMTEEGGKKFAEVTTGLVGKKLAMFLDDLPLSAPTVEQAITEGRGIIRGGFTTESAKRLALQLSAGALPTPIRIIEQRNIGATLGNVSVTKSVRAGVVGLTMVAIFMLAYYGRLGVIANLALITYGLITYALFRIIPVTLTLPGITGFILSIGMAVDANILIFERMKEEISKGKPWQIAMELGFGRAWDSIRDANLTTLITAFILYNPLNWSFIPASGMVRGFALTLALGVLVSLFTGTFVSRNLIRAFYRPK